MSVVQTFNVRQGGRGEGGEDQGDHGGTGALVSVIAYIRLTTPYQL